MSQELQVIINPTSGNGRAGRSWPQLARRLRGLGFLVEGHQTRYAGHAIEIARDLAAAGAREIVVVGGDGTTNEVINGLFQSGHPLDEVTLSVIPTGTGRDFSRSLGIRGTDHALEVLSGNTIKAIDVGRISYQDGDGPRERYFVNCADVGLGAETAALLNRSSKFLGGFLAYLIGAARTILTFRGQVARVSVDLQEIYHGPIGMVVLANGSYHAGGMYMAPMASMADGQFEVLILREVSKLTLLGSLLPRVYRGRHIGHPAVLHHTGRCVTIETDGPLLFETDGEQPGTTDLEAVILPGALRVRVDATRTCPASS